MVSMDLASLCCVDVHLNAGYTCSDAFMSLDSGIYGFI